MKPLITLKPLQHRGSEHIGILYKNNLALNILVRSKAGGKWSQTHRCWYIPLSRETYNKLKMALKGLATVENGELKKYLEEKNNPAAKKVTSSKVNNALLEKETSHIKPAAGISSINKHVISEMVKHLQLKGYSSSTTKTYTNEIAVFLKTIKDHSADEFSTKRLKDYLSYCAATLKLTENTLHSRMNALKFYYEQVLNRPRFFWEIPRPKKPIQLPKVLNKEEIALLLRAIENLKHKTMLMLAYSCGLRVSEITALRLTDVDENRRLLIIRRGKGKKDRVISISPAMLIILRHYKEKYKPADYLFEGQSAGSSYSIRSLESIIHRAKEKAGIKKAGSMHMLRHSFATHLLDKGTDVVFIQRLLGHNDIKTTLRYLHVTNKDILNILSPLEDIKDLIG